MIASGKKRVLLVPGGILLRMRGTFSGLEESSQRRRCPRGLGWALPSLKRNDQLQRGPYAKFRKRSFGLIQSARVRAHRDNWNGPLHQKWDTPHAALPLRASLDPDRNNMKNYHAMVVHADNDGAGYGGRGSAAAMTTTNAATATEMAQ